MKTLFILGGTGDIGKAIVKKFSDNGYSVVSPSRNELNLEDRLSIERYFKFTKIKKIEVLIYCVGWNNPKAIKELTYTDLDKANEINAISLFGILQKVLPGMVALKKGHVLAISSLYGSFSRKGRLAYVMSKHALNGLIKTVALEFGRYDIKVNTLSPGFVDTKMTRKNNDNLVIKQIKQCIPLGHLAMPIEIANIALFLCSEQNTYITGQDIIVDGGYSVGGFQR
jgi:3-oxoacyl-[acyl-carrier protein] reductase